MLLFQIVKLKVTGKGRGTVQYRYVHFVFGTGESPVPKTKAARPNVDATSLCKSLPMDGSIPTVLRPKSIQYL